MTYHFHKIHASCLPLEFSCTSPRYALRNLISLSSSSSCPASSLTSALSPSRCYLARSSSALRTSSSPRRASRSPRSPSISFCSSSRSRPRARSPFLRSAISLSSTTRSFLARVTFSSRSASSAFLRSRCFSASAISRFSDFRFPLSTRKSKSRSRSRTGHG